MKKIIIILLSLFVICMGVAKAQTQTAFDSAVQNSLKKMFTSTDTLAKIVTMIKSGVFVIDTLSCPVNSLKHFQLFIGGYNKTKKVWANVDVWISNTAGIYEIEGSPIINTNLGQGNRVDIIKQNGLMMLRLFMLNSTTFNWILKKQ